MSVVPRGEWFWTLVKAVEEQQKGITDRIGRPWAQHFERVALRCFFRNPRASRAQLEAALLHDAFMDRGGGQFMLETLAVSEEALDIIRITTPPPDADYYRAFEAIGPAECEIYLDYARKLATSGRQAAIEMKLADVTDTIDACRVGATEVLIGQWRDRYEPTRKILEAALSSMV